MYAFNEYMGRPRPWSRSGTPQAMAPLAPEILQSIVTARTDQAVVLEKLERPG
jgi:hypothetical protein